MTGRDDLCSCGSGKKYKKCCALKSEPASDKLIEEELARILYSYYENAIGSQADYAELEGYEKEWVSKLGKTMPREDIDKSVTEYFLFIARRDLWKRHLLKTLNGPIRSITRTVLEAWQDPIVLFGKVKVVNEDHFLVDEILGHSAYHLKIEEGMDVEKDLLVFGIVLPDAREQENGILLLEGLMFIYDANGMLIQQIESLAEKSGEANSYDFFKKHMVDIHKIILNHGVNSAEDFAESELSDRQIEVLEILEGELASHHLPPDKLEFIKMITITYFLKEEPVFRKPEIIAAALFKVINDLEIIEDHSYTQADIAKIFNVSSESMMKHVDRLYDMVGKIAEVMKRQLDDEPVMVYSIGTDPRMTERVNWEMYSKTVTQEFDTVEEFHAYLNETKYDLFEPIDKKHQAQVLAYNAYEAELDIQRYRLAKRAYALDPENIDAVLLQAEMTAVSKEAERLYKKAIELGQAKFDDESKIPWTFVTNRPYMRAIFSYGIWLYKRNRFGSASKQFDKLLEINPEDHQGARYLAISSFIFNGDFLNAFNILKDYEELSDEAPYLYLEWLLEMKQTQGKSPKSAEIYRNAEEENPFVTTLIEEDLPKVPYPRQLSISPGSIEEAMYIWYLL